MTRTSQRQWNDLRQVGDAWRYWPEGDFAPSGPVFSTLIEALHWPDLPALRAARLRETFGVPKILEYQPALAGRLYLPAIHTIVYTTRWAIARQRRIIQILEAFRFSNWSFFFAEKTTPYWRDIPSHHAAFLRENDPPLLILEDDAEVLQFEASLDIPPGTEIAYLGGGRSGDKIGRIETKRAWPQSRPAFGYRYWDESEAWMRIGGMWFSHAILYLEHAVMLDVAARLSASDHAIDTTLARHQWRWNVQCRKIPSFWQNDGHHYRDTLHYEPSLWRTTPNSYDS